MKVPLIGWKQQPGSPLFEARSSVDSVPASDLKALIVYGPVARMNPYQALVYGGFREQGIATSELIPLGEYPKAKSLRSLAPHVGLHIHWPGGLISSAKSEDDGRRLISEISRQLDMIQESGVKIIYTVHNMVSHDARFPESERTLQNLFISQSDVLHSMTYAGLDRVRAEYDIKDSNVIVSPHPVYKGVYPNYFSKAESRRFLGLGEDDRIVTLFGAIKPYKGLRLVREIWDKFEKKGIGPYLVVAGKPDGTNEAKKFVKWAEANSRVLVYSTKVPFEQVQIFVNAADFGLVPYELSLNSGAALLFATFHRPVIGIKEPSVFEGFPVSSYLSFDNKLEFEQILLNIGGSGQSTLRDMDWQSFLESRDPAALSADFAKKLLQALQLD